MWIFGGGYIPLESKIIKFLYKGRRTDFADRKVKIADFEALRALSLNYKTSYPPSKRFLDKISNLHLGYRTVLTWYMWRSIDPTDVEY